jgi:3-oxoacyl-[acyl-carrier-protein] synthase III
MRPDQDTLIDDEVITKPVIRAEDVAFGVIKKERISTNSGISFRAVKKNKIQLPLKISASGYYIPKKVINNEYYAKKFKLDPIWIEKVTGIKYRHFAADDEECSDLAVKAIKAMMSKVSLKNEDIDLIIFSSMGGDYSAPPTACIIQHKVKMYNAKAFDIIGSCTSFVQSLQIASLYLKTGLAKNIILVSSDVPSRGSDPNHMKTRILFGDGAGCLLVNNEPKGESGVVAHDFGTDGRHWDVATILGGGTTYPVPNKKIGDNIWFRMDGKRIYKIAIDKISSSIDKVLKDSKMNIEDIHLIVPHQANYRIIQSLLKKLGGNREKMYLTIEKYGNTATASMAITLAEAIKEKGISKGDYLLLISFGAGFNWGVMLIKC